mmetsp:Transcript_41726/g.104271  ORF Transcript_41726/g.104271 Transcript_41726/m.104271 type:complete len:201 (-) Transcript_41726:353-955(-)
MTWALFLTSLRPLVAALAMSVQRLLLEQSITWMRESRDTARADTIFFAIKSFIPVFLSDSVTKPLEFSTTSAAPSAQLLSSSLRVWSTELSGRYSAMTPRPRASMPVFDRSKLVSAHVGDERKAAMSMAAELPRSLLAMLSVCRQAERGRCHPDSEDISFMEMLRWRREWLVRSSCMSLSHSLPMQLSLRSRLFTLGRER